MAGQNPIQALATPMPSFPPRFALPLFAFACVASFSQEEEYVLEKPGRPKATLLVRSTPNTLHVIANSHTTHQREFVYERFRPGDTE